MERWPKKQRIEGEGGREKKGEGAEKCVVHKHTNRRMKESEQDERQATEGCCSSYDIAALIVCSEPQAGLQKYSRVCVCV